MRFLGHELRLFLVALQLLTRLPVRTRGAFDTRWLTASVRYYPLVGAIVGGIAAAVLWGAQQLWTPAIAAVLAVAASAWLTSAFHEDGLADTCDALLGTAPRETALTIMKDSRIGTYGTVALLLTTLLRVGLLTVLAADDLTLACAALIAGHAWARCGAVVLMAVTPYGGDSAQAKVAPLARAVPWTLAATALAWCALAVLLPLPGWRLLIAAGVLLAWAILMRGWLLRRLGGFTGDTLGATEQVGEVLFLLVLAAQLA